MKALILYMIFLGVYLRRLVVGNAGSYEEHEGLLCHPEGYLKCFIWNMPACVKAVLLVLAIHPTAVPNAMDPINTILDTFSCLDEVCWQRLETGLAG